MIEQFGPDSFDRSAVTPISDDVRQWIDELASLGEQEGFQLLVVSVPMELGAQERASLNAEIDRVLAEITAKLGGVEL